MISCYIRSSSMGTYENWCEMKYFLNYTLGFKDKSNFKAEKGTCTHKALELLAHKKLCEQKGVSSFFDAELDKTYQVAELFPNLAIRDSFNYYRQNSEHQWGDEDFSDITDWVFTVLNFNDGMFSPLKRTVVDAEKHFDIEITEPWAKFEYDTPQGKLAGNLHLKGTLDLILGVGPDTIELVDYKTGSNKNYDTGKEKTHEDFHKDTQLLLYYYCLSKLYLEMKSVIITIYYIKNGPTTLGFNKSHIKIAEKLIKDHFLSVQANTNPKVIRNDSSMLWKCKYLCGHYGNNFKNGKDTCQTIQKEIVQLGIDKVTNKYCNFDALTKYQSGGGRTSRD